MKRKLLLITLLFLLTTSLFSQVQSEKNSQITFKEFFYKFYSEFIKVDFTYSQYINSEIGFYCISNPGSLIFLDKCSGTERGEFYSNMSLENVKLSFQKPVGNKVEGYPGFSDGFMHIRFCKKICHKDGYLLEKTKFQQKLLFHL